MKSGATALRWEPIGNLKLVVVDHQDTMPKRRHWNPWKLAKNLTKTAIMVSVAMVLIKMILAH